MNYVEVSKANRADGRTRDAIGPPAGGGTRRVRPTRPITTTLFFGSQLTYGNRKFKKQNS